MQVNPILKVDDFSRLDNLKRWMATFTCGTVSLLTCFMCCGCTQSPEYCFEHPDVINYDNVPENEKKMYNKVMWGSLGFLTCLYAPIFCGFCFGGCGSYSPRDAMKSFFFKYYNE